MDTDFTFEDALSLTKPCYMNWMQEDLTVVRDGYMDCGTRIHVVAEQQYKTPVMIANAIVISEDYEFLGK